MSVSEGLGRENSEEDTVPVAEYVENAGQLLCPEFPRPGTRGRQYGCADRVEQLVRPPCTPRAAPRDPALDGATESGPGPLLLPTSPQNRVGAVRGAVVDRTAHGDE